MKWIWKQFLFSSYISESCFTLIHRQFIKKSGATIGNCLMTLPKYIDWNVVIYLIKRAGHLQQLLADTTKMHWLKRSYILYIFLFSDGYTTEDLTLRWEHPDPLEMSKDIKLSEFILSNVRTDNCSAVYSTGTFLHQHNNFQFNNTIDLLTDCLKHYWVQTYDIYMQIRIDNQQ